MKLIIDDLRFGYSGNSEVLHGIHCRVSGGKLTCIVGPNGCGKTTLIKCVNRIHKPWAGQILLDGQDLTQTTPEKIACLIGYVPQVSHGGIGGTVIDFVLLGRRQYLNWRLRREDLESVLAVLERLDILDLADREYHTLSGGQRQKVLMARALLQESPVYVFDEPTSSLDIKNQLEILNLARELVDRENKTVLMVLHDLNLALHYADEVILMCDGKIVAQGPAGQVLTEERIEEVYGVRTKLESCGYINPFPKE